MQDRISASQTQTPAGALILGWLGVIPFAALAIMAATGTRLSFIESRGALVAYGAVILSFMGAVHWGRAAASRTPGMASVYVASVLPALWAWGCLMIDEVPALIALGAGFAALLAYDLMVAKAGALPSWYGHMRWQLTTAVLVCLVIALWGS